MALDANIFTNEIWSAFFLGEIGEVIYRVSDDSMIQYALKKFSEREPIHSMLEVLIDAMEYDNARVFLEHIFHRATEAWPNNQKLYVE